MRLILVEPSLNDQKGHYFLLASVLVFELEKRRVAYEIFGNLYADDECLKLGNFHPCFIEITNTILKKGVVISNFFYLFRLIKQFKNQLNAALFSNPNFSLRNNDIILFHTLHFMEFAVLGWVLWRNSRFLRKNNIKFFVGFNHTLKRDPFFLTWILASVFLITDKFFINRSKINIVYFSAVDTVAKQFQSLLRKNVVFLPTPVAPLLYQPEISGGCGKLPAGPKKKIKIAYLGGARYAKGFHTFVMMIEKLSAEGRINEEIRLLAQVNINDSQSIGHSKVTQEYIDKLYSLAKNIPNFEIISGTLSLQEYYKLLLGCDIIVLPYSHDLYRTAGSNIFNETIIAGKVPVVTRHTLMAANLLEYSLEELTFERENVDDLVKAVKNAVVNYKDYQFKLRKLQEEYKKIFSVDNFVNALLKI